MHTRQLQSFTAHINQLTKDVEVCSREVVNGLLDEGADVASTARCVQEEFETPHGQLAAQVIEEGPFILIGDHRTEDHVLPRYGQSLQGFRGHLSQLGQLVPVCKCQKLKEFLRAFYLVQVEGL